MSKIGIIGCGWLGTPLAVSLLNKGFSVVGTTTSDKKRNDLSKMGIEAHHWELNDEVSRTKLGFLEELDILILNIPPGKIKSTISYSSLLQMFANLISDSTNVLFLSTTSVYPEIEKEISEEYEWTCTDLLMETVQAEIKLKEIFGSRLTILRLAGLIGNERHPVKYLSGKTEIPNGNAPVNLIHLNDAIGLIEKIIEKKYWGEILNGCFPDHPSKSEYYCMIANYLGITPPEFRDELVTEKYVSSQKSIDKLGYNYRHPISSLEN